MLDKEYLEEVKKFLEDTVKKHEKNIEISKLYLEKINEELKKIEVQDISISKTLNIT